MTDQGPFFVTRGGAVWACWLDGRAAVNLGQPEEVASAMREFLADPPSAEPAPSAPTAQPEPPPPAPPPPPPPTPPRTPVDRAAERHELTIVGRIFTGRGSREVTIFDLSETGCRFLDQHGRPAVGSPLTIKVGPVGPIEATVKWLRDGFVGIAFRSPLYPSVLDHIRQHFDLRK